MASKITRNNIMIADILSRLPVKTLLRGNLDSFCNGRDFDFRPLEPAGCRYVYNFISIDTEGNMISPIQVKVQEPVKLILPGCHGLLCLATETRIHVFNPSTRHLVALPADGGETAGFGIGYLSPAKGHVVVRLNIPRQSRTSLSWKLECSVFTFLPENGGPRWRAVEGRLPVSGGAVQFSGVR
ncbi:hypothetical protein OIU76_023762 [Salix suchowensis]|nr:hypothetical protein OIU76_023762 [Salix suchowensis]